MNDLALLYVTFGSRDEAEQVAQTVLAERLAACVTILPTCTSIFRWQEGIERAEEVPALFKTRPALAPRLRERLVALHSYELPVIESWPAEAGEAVTRWIEGETA